MDPIKYTVFQDEVTRAEIRKLSEAKDEDALKARLGSRMSFGTAGSVVACTSMLVTPLSTGLRAAMGAGYSRMNQLTIIQTTQVSFTICYVILFLMTCQGLCEFILKEFKDARQRGVVVGRDARRNSEM